MAADRAGRSVADQAEAVLRFWFEELTPGDWFRGADTVDELVRSRFCPLHERLSDAVGPAWESHPRLALAAVIVLDQFSRNIHRGSERAFAADSTALALAKRALERGDDRALEPEQRKFLYMPLMHAEVAAEQARCVDLFAALGDEVALGFAERHKAVVDRFGRFPHRNDALGRESTAEERSFLEEPGSSF